MTANAFPTRVRDPQRNIVSIAGVGNPNTLGISAGKGSDYADTATGAVYDFDGTTWQQRANASGGTAAWANITGKPTTIAGYGITDAYDQTTSDGRYLQKSGGTLTGRLNSYPSVNAGPVVDLFNASTTAGSHVLQVRPGVNTNYGVAVLDASTSAINAYIRGDGYASFSGATIAGTAFTQSGIAALLAGATIPGALTSTGVIQSTTTNGFALGSVSGVARIMFGASTSTAFSLLQASNAYADLYLAAIVATSSITATNSSGAVLNLIGNRSYSVVSDSSGSLRLDDNTAGATRWYLSSNGHLFTGAHNTYDIGATGAMPRNIYAASTLAGGQLAVGGTVAVSGALSTFYQGSFSVGVRIQRPSASGAPLLQFSDGVTYAATIYMGSTGDLIASGSTGVFRAVDFVLT